jgi:hypothetical protein
MIRIVQTAMVLIPLLMLFGCYDSIALDESGEPIEEETDGSSSEDDKNSDPSDRGRSRTDDADTDIFDIVEAIDCDDVDEDSCDYMFCSLRGALSELSEACAEEDELTSYCNEVEKCLEIYYNCELESCPLGEDMEDADSDDFEECIDEYIDCIDYTNDLLP